MLEERFKFFQARSDQLGLADLVDHSLLRLQAVPSDAQDNAFVSRNMTGFD